MLHDFEEEYLHLLTYACPAHSVWGQVTCFCSHRPVDGEECAQELHLIQMMSAGLSNWWDLDQILNSGLMLCWDRSFEDFRKHEGQVWVLGTGGRLQ